LGDPYAELYWELLATLYRREFEREPFVVLRPVAHEVAENTIRSSTLWSTRRTELEAFAREDPAGSEESEAPDENALARIGAAVIGSPGT